MSAAQRVAALRSWHDDWRGLRVAVLGLGVTGFSVADTLVELGAVVTVVAANASDDRVGLLAVIGSGFAQAASDEEQVRAIAAHEPDLVVVSPGVRPQHPVIAWAERSGVTVWGDIQLAWRLRDKVGTPAEWILVTGTNGKTTTTQLTAHMLLSAGFRVAPVGNIGTPVLDALRDPGGFDVLVVELSSFQLHRLGDIEPYSSVCLNIADDHLDWHGSVADYVASKARIYEHTRVACVYNRADERTLRLVEDADVVEGARAVSFGLDVPPRSGLGVVEGVLCDRAFHEDRANSARELTTLDALAARGLAVPHIVQNILAAAALACSFGVTPQQVAAALDAFELDHHRVERVALLDGVQWVDDSKATNPHAADAALRSFASIVWVVGGDFKGVHVAELIATHAPRLRAAVCIGVEQEALLAAFAEHAPHVQVIAVRGSSGTEVMDRAVAEANRVAQPGDTVLLAPAAASQDQFVDYADRGRSFVRALRQLEGGGVDEATAESQ